MDGHLSIGIPSKKNRQNRIPAYLSDNIECRLNVFTNTILSSVHASIGKSLG